MAPWLAKRVVALTATLFAVSGLTFVLVAITPGDPVRANLYKFTPADTHRQLDHLYGLDLPLWQQYLRYMRNLVHGDLGLS